jgi:signal peptidase I
MRELNLKQADLACLANEMHLKGGALCFKARGSSMYPFIRDGDILAIQPVKVNDLRTGDILSFKSTAQKVVAHRLVQKHFRKGDIFLRTRGDAAMEPDDLITENQIIGRVSKIKRGHKVILINHKFRRLMSVTWTKCAPLGPLLLKFVVSIRRICARIIP